jgi:tRNA-modifying protein YgfZ
MSEYLYGIEKSHRSIGQSMQALRDYQSQMGAHLETDIPVSFGDDAQALMAAEQSTALYDRSHWGRIRVFDRDRLTFLHNQSTNDLKRLQPGQGCETVILTSTARTIDLVSVFATDEEVLLLTAPNRREQMLSWLDRYIFFGDKVQLEDKTDSTVCFSLIGPSSSNLLMKLGMPELPQELDAHFLGVIADIPVRVANGSGLSTPGYTLIADKADGLTLWKNLVEADAVPLGEKAWEQLRICQGRPMPGTELTEDYNPLEAGLWNTVSFNKGCYIGQETIARLNTYNGVKQQLWGLTLDSSSEPGTLIYLEDQKIGVLTSVVGTPKGFFGLGYIKTKAGGAGLTVRVGEVNATVVDVPFLSRSLEPAV